MTGVQWKMVEYHGDGTEIVHHYQDRPYVFFLDSSLKDRYLGRYSFIGFEPFKVVQSKGENSMPELRNQFLFYQKQFQSIIANESLPNWVPWTFPAGIVGFLSYDYGFQLEKIKQQSLDDLRMPDCLFGFYDCVLTIDHAAHQLIICSTGLPETDPAARNTRAQQRLQEIWGEISGLLGQNENNEAEALEQPRQGHFPLQGNFSKDEFCQKVEKALAYIRQGEIYQVNLSQRFSLGLSFLSQRFRPFELYRFLRQQSAASFACYFNAAGFQILSSSPERYLKLQNGIVETRPMKGTRPRGKDTREDRYFRESLLNSHKDKAELLMITDLERNDLGKVCRFGSVKVAQMRTLEEYSTVYQTTSTVQGVLDDGKNGFDLLTACFPGGSITGCPKIRAMNIIEELEPTRRGPYTGSLGYLSFTGDMDFNILIRTILVSGDHLSFQVGGGVVADSVPEDEYQETLIKAQAMIDAIGRFTIKDSAHKVH